MSNFFRALALLLAALIGSATSVILGAPFARLLRFFVGPLWYWSIGALVSSPLLLDPSLAQHFAFLISVWLTVGIFCELEAIGHASFWSALVSVVVGTSAALGIASLHIYRERLTFESVGAAFEKNLVDMGLVLEPGVRIWPQIPSFFAIALIAALVFSFSFEAAIARLLGMRINRPVVRLRLFDLAVPESLIWPLIFSFFLSFYKGLPEVWSQVGANLLNVIMMGYFFQGFGVLSVWLTALNFDLWARRAIYILAALQFFWLLSLVGVADFWLNIRSRIRNWKLKRSGIEK